MRRVSKICLAIICAVLVIPCCNTVALSNEKLDKYAANNILFYDPDSNCASYGVGGTDWDSGSGGGWTERLQTIVIQYGQLSMDLQREWGVPWEVVFAQMIKESSLGTAPNGINAGVAKNGYYNWLGITGKGGAYSVGTPFVDGGGRKWAQYATIEDMIKDYSGKYIARNGYYDKAFLHLVPSDYDLEGYLSDFIMVYAPPVENDTSTYISQMMPYINSIREIGKTQGWPTSEELAIQENIQPGGRNPIGGSAGGGGDDNYPTPVSCSVSSRSDLRGFSSVAEAEAALKGLYYSENLSGILPGLSVPKTGDPHDNCVAFTQWFMIKFTSITNRGMTGNGNRIAYNYYDAFHNQFPGMTTSNTPTLYSISSWSSGVWTNHTGVIVGINGDDVIIAQAGWDHRKLSFTSKKKSAISGNGNYYVSIIDYIEPQGILR